MTKITNIKLGLWSFSTCNGLGNQTRAYFDHLKPYRTLVHDISAFNKLEQHPEWYPSSPEHEVIFDYGFPTNDAVDKFLEGLDVVLVAENPLSYYMFAKAKEMGVKTILVPNFEFLEFLRNPLLPVPDLFLAPSTWRIDEIKQFGETEYLHFPVDRNKVKRREINNFDFFLHIIGNPAVHDRNGTISTIEAIKNLDNKKASVAVMSPSLEKLETLPLQARAYDPRVTYMVSDKVIEYENLYLAGSVMVLPRRYGGNCLPMNEALAAGMPVIMTDISPQADFLPKEWLVPAEVISTFKARTGIDVYNADQDALKEKLDWFANMKPEELAVESQRASELADTISWKTLLPKYEEVIERLVKS